MGRLDIKKSERREESSKGIHLSTSWMQTRREVPPQSCKHTVCTVTDYMRLTNTGYSFLQLLPSGSLVTEWAKQTAKQGNPSPGWTFSLAPSFLLCNTEAWDSTSQNFELVILRAEGQKDWPVILLMKSVLRSRHGSSLYEPLTDS